MLVVDISINRDRHISTIGAVRVSPKDKEEIGSSEICQYEVGRVYDGKIKRPAGTIEHTYGDGAEVLAGKAINKVASLELSSFEEDNLERLMCFVDKHRK